MKMKFVIVAVDEPDYHSDHYAQLEIRAYPIDEKLPEDASNGVVLTAHFDTLVKQDINWLYRTHIGLKQSKKNQKWIDKYYKEYQKIKGEFNA